MRKLSVVLMAGALLLPACGDSDDDSDPVASGGGGGQTTTTMGDMAGMPGMDPNMPGMDHSGHQTSTCSPSGTALTITASERKFDKDCLAAPTGQAFTIAFDNKDAGTNHNIVILKSHTDTGQPLFRAPLIQGAKVETLNVSALQAGTYAFHCEVHPNAMSGSFVVK